MEYSIALFVVTAFTRSGRRKQALHRDAVAMRF